jgi:hypothetical protein
VKRIGHLAVGVALAALLLVSVPGRAVAASCGSTGSVAWTLDGVGGWTAQVTVSCQTQGTTQPTQGSPKPAGRDPLSGESCTYEAEPASAEPLAQHPYLYYEDHYGFGDAWQKPLNSSGQWVGYYALQAPAWVSRDSGGEIVISYDSPSGWLTASGAGIVGSETWTTAQYQASTYYRSWPNPLKADWVGYINFQLSGTYNGSNWNCNQVNMWSAQGVSPIGPCTGSACVPTAPAPSACVGNVAPPCPGPVNVIGLLAQVAENYNPGNVTSTTGASWYYVSVPYAVQISNTTMPFQQAVYSDSASSGSGATQISVDLVVDVQVMQVTGVTWYYDDCGYTNSTNCPSPDSAGGAAPGGQASSPYTYMTSEAVSPYAMTTVVATINTSATTCAYGGVGIACNISPASASHVYTTTGPYFQVRQITAH